MAQKITVLNGQNLVDIAIQHTGSVESVVELAVANDISITQQLTAGSTLNSVPEKDERIVDYYAVRNLSPATTASDRNATRRRGIGNMTIGQDFKVG